MSNELTSNLNIFHSQDRIMNKKYIISVEVSEGGIIVKYEGNPEWYKHLRFHSYKQKHGIGMVYFPIVPPFVMEDWCESIDEVFPANV